MGCIIKNENIRTMKRRNFIFGLVGLLIGGCAVPKLESKANFSRNRILQEPTRQLTRDYILEEGIQSGSDLWNDIKNGKYSGVGRSNEEWVAYLSHVESCRNNFFRRLNQSTRTELNKYPFKIRGFGGGGSLLTEEVDYIKIWDDFSDMNSVNFEGVNIRYSEDSLPEESELVHEYSHAIWRIYGTYASKETRKIDREQFALDTERLVKDSKYADILLINEIKETWGFKNDIIQQVLSERFTSLSEIYYKNKRALPNYIRRHFKSFF